MTPLEDFQKLTLAGTSGLYLFSPVFFGFGKMGRKLAMTRIKNMVRSIFGFKTPSPLKGLTGL